ncbi:MAG: hypothetical protein Q3980_05425 [Turicibacter sp.]|nr:hypothetical protein [Turicibacter sp.]
MYYFKNFFGLPLIFCLIYHSINVNNYDFYVWILLLIWFIQRHQINQQLLILIGASVLSFIYLILLVSFISRQILIQLIILFGIFLMLTIGLFDYMIIRHIKHKLN